MMGSTLESWNDHIANDHIGHGSLSRRSILSGALGLASGRARADPPASPPASETRDGVTLTVKDLTPRFLDFYRAAKGLAPDARFAVWKARYDFAAVPPTPEGDRMARKMLDAAWPRYPTALARISRGAGGMRPPPLGVAVAVANLLQAERPVRIGLTTYVGTFETNAFTNDTPGGPVVAVPLEIPDEVRGLLLPHEMTHAAHMLTAHLAPGYERTLGRVVFEEGLAMRATQRLVPGLQDYRYVGDRNWFDAAMADRAAILAALRPKLERSDADTVLKYTMGQGATGREREAYIAGWLAVGRLLDQGRSFTELARIPEDQLPAVAASALDSLGASS